MKNFEKFEKEIMEITRKGYAVALSNNKLIDCGSIICPDCDWSSNNNKDSFCCSARKILWLYKEYIERPKLSKQERKFCELFEGKDVWFATDKDCQSCIVYTEKPIKRDFQWTGHHIQTINIRDFISAKFDFIKWEDEEPWNIEDLLKLEVEE